MLSLKFFYLVNKLNLIFRIHPLDEIRDLARDFGFTAHLHARGEEAKVDETGTDPTLVVGPIAK